MNLRDYTTADLMAELASRKTGYTAVVNDAQAASRQLGISLAILRDGRGNREVAALRDAVSSHLADLGHSHTRIAFALGRRNHSSVTKAIKRHRRRISP